MRTLIPALLFTLLLSPASEGHPVFADTLKNQLKLYRVECIACHAKGEQYHLRNGLGLRFETLLPDSLTWQYHSVLAMGDPKAIRSQERAMAKSFSLILSKLAPEPVADTTLKALIRSGDLEGIKPMK